MGCIVTNREHDITSSVIKKAVNQKISEVGKSKKIDSDCVKVYKTITCNHNLSRLTNEVNRLPKKYRTECDLLNSRDFLLKLESDIDKIENLEKKMPKCNINDQIWRFTSTIQKNDGKFFNNKIYENEIFTFKNPLYNEDTKNRKTQDTILDYENEFEEQFFIENNSFIGEYTTKDNFLNAPNISDSSLISNLARIGRGKNTLMITGLNISTYKVTNSKKISEELSTNTLDTLRRKQSENKCKLSEISDNQYSNQDDCEKSVINSGISNTNNSYYNLNIFRKYFIYQLIKSLLHVKKYLINNAIHSGNMANLHYNPIYYEIFSNYSQIKTSEVLDYIKYDDKNLKINNYYISKNKVLGKGGFSTVYLCKCLIDEIYYAVKITNKITRANARKKKYDYVKEEVNVLKRIHSKYIVKTFEIIDIKNECLIFMELMKNKSLFFNISSLDDFKVWKYFRNLICGVEHCHAIANIVHRDININNLLISDDDILKLSDFGVSMIIENNNDLISINSGPTTYTPPEKKFENKDYHGKPADMWSCGVVLYHMVFKRPLKLEKHNYSIQLPEYHDYMINPNLKELLLNLLDENPQKRNTFDDLKTNAWITKNGEFPLPDIHQEAVDYLFSLTCQEIIGYKRVHNQ